MGNIGKTEARAPRAVQSKLRCYVAQRVRHVGARAAETLTRPKLPPEGVRIYN